MIKIKANFIQVTEKWLWLWRFNGITIIPWVFMFGQRIHKSAYKFAKFSNHEKIHVRQVEDEMNKYKSKIIGWIVWYTKYLTEWIKYGYRNNIYEVEAYANDQDFTYLDRRKPFAYKKYRDVR
jgi:hypothetical protein